MSKNQGSVSGVRWSTKACRQFAAVMISTLIYILLIPPLPALAATEITIQSPAGNGPLEPGVVHLSGTYTGVYDIELAVNGKELVDAHLDDPDADDAGSWTADVDLSAYDGAIEIAARGRDRSTRYVIWSPFINVEVNNPDASVPVVNVVSPTEKGVLKGKAPIKIEATGKNEILGVQVRINGGEWQDAAKDGKGYSLEWKIGPGSRQTYSLEARASDSKGNTGYSRTVYVKTKAAVGDAGEISAELDTTVDNQDMQGQGQVNNYNQDRAIWIWENESYPLILNQGSRTVLEAMAADTDTFGQDPVHTLYLAVGEYNGSRMLEDQRPAVRDFVRFAHERGYHVQALIAGGTKPPYFGAYSRYRNQAINEFEGILNFNLSSEKDERFDGVNIDTEPYSLPDFKSAKPSVQVQYLDMLQALMERKQASGQALAVGAAIPRWFDSSVDAQNISWHGSVKWLSEHIQDTIDYISIMDYRDQAEGSVGIIEQARGEIEYADRIGKPDSVIIGIETKDIADGGDPETITFNEEGRLYLEAELDKVYAAFNSSPGFGGIAIHDYGSIRNLPSEWGPAAVFWQPPPDSEPPSAVTGTPRVSAFDFQRIDVAYGPASDNAYVNEYHIYRGEDPQFETDAAHLAGVSNGLDFEDTGLLPDTTYTYKVTAVDSSGNEGPASEPVTATTGSTTLIPMIVDQLVVSYDGAKAKVTFKVIDKETGEGVPAAVYGRFTYMAGKYVSGSTLPGGTFTANSEGVTSPSGEIGFLPRRITAPGYYWAQAYDSSHDQSTRWGG